jgi:hypothetical protein
MTRNPNNYTDSSINTLSFHVSKMELNEEDNLQRQGKQGRENESHNKDQDLRRDSGQ